MRPAQGTTGAARRLDRSREAAGAKRTHAWHARGQRPQEPPHALWQLQRRAVQWAMRCGSLLKPAFLCKHGYYGLRLRNACHAVAQRRAMYSQRTVTKQAMYRSWLGYCKTAPQPPAGRRSSSEGAWTDDSSVS